MRGASSDPEMANRTGRSHRPTFGRPGAGPNVAMGRSTRHASIPLTPRRRLGLRGLTCSSRRLWLRGSRAARSFEQGPPHRRLPSRIRLAPKLAASLRFSRADPDPYAESYFHPRGGRARSSGCYAERSPELHQFARRLAGMASRGACALPSVPTPSALFARSPPRTYEPTQARQDTMG
jgi:hypothetical protein